MSDEYLGENQPARRTTPTWEIELLISGATVFGLMQLPGPLNRTLIIWMNGNEEAIVALLKLMSIYLQFSLIVLILTFVLHLLARAYWVAMVGMYSVYPQGIRWDKKTFGGPIYNELGATQEKSMPELIEQADNRATKIFGMGFGMAIAMTVASAIVGMMILILMFVQAANGDLDKWSTGLWIGLGVVILPYFITYLVDEKFGKKLQASGKAAWIKRVFSVYQHLGFGNSSNPVISIYTTNEGVKKTTIMYGIVMVPLMFAVGVFASSRGTIIDNGAYDGLPKMVFGAEHIIRPEYYASSRGDTYVTTQMPYIEDAIVSSSFLRLFIPYQPASYNLLLEEKCPDSLTRKAANKGEGLSCLSQVLAIQIDNQAVSVPLMAGIDNQTGQRGIVAMIDVRKLGAGQHELKLKALLNERSKENRKGQQGRFHRIPFWK